MGKARQRWLIGCVVAALVVVPLVAGAFAGGGIFFGLSTAPNGDLLVADATVGILTLSGDVVVNTIPLPGVTDMSAFGRGSMWAVTGAQGSPEEDTGQALYRIVNGQPRLVVNLFEFEETFNPAPPPDVPDSNPFDVEALSGRAALVADAGGNDLLRISRHGDVDVLATFPDEIIAGVDFPVQAVPDSIAVGRDGYYYVGELKGFPGPIGESRIWKVSPQATGAACPNPDCVEVIFDEGFTSIIDLAFGPDGNLYVVELDEASWTAVEIFGGELGGTINSCDLETMICTVVETGILEITAITFDKVHNLWATRNAITPGLAEVFQVS